MSRFRPRFSLLNVLLLLTIAGLGVTIYQLGKEVVPLRAENKRLNEERGTLVFDDSTRVHAIRVPSRFAGQKGAFRVFIPEGPPYVAIAAVNEVPKDGFPKVERREDADMILGQAGKNAFARLDPGEHQLWLSVKYPTNGKPQVVFAVGTHGGLDMTVGSSKDSWPQVQSESYGVSETGVKGTTESFPAGQPLVLLRHRLHALSNESLSVSYALVEPDHPLDGLMLWIEPLDQ